MLNENIGTNETKDMYGFIKEIMCNSEMENTIEIDKESIQKIKTTKNCLCKFKDTQGKGYYFKYYTGDNYKQIRTIYNALEGRRLDVLPKVYCKYSDKNGFCIIEEEIEGKNIQDYIHEKCNSIVEILEIVKKLCKGVEKIHNLLLVHCDLTPVNIIVCKNNSDTTVKIIDLECVFMVDAIEGYDRKPMGTRKYVAEEVFNSPSSIDRRTDIYSIGVILEEWIKASNCLESYDVNIKDKVDAIISRCNGVKQNDRYNNATELMYALNEIEAVIYLDTRLRAYAGRNGNISLTTFYGDRKEILSGFHNDQDKKDEIIYLLYDNKNEASIRFSLNSFKYAKGKILGLDGKKINAFEKRQLSKSAKLTDKYEAEEFSNIIAVEKTKDGQLRILKEINENAESKVSQKKYKIGYFDVIEIEELISLIVEKRKMFYSPKSRIEYYQSEYDKIVTYQKNEKRSVRLSYQIFLGEKINSILEEESIGGKPKNLGKDYYDYAEEKENSYKSNKNSYDKDIIIAAYNKAIQYGYAKAEDAKENFIKQNTKDDKKSKKEEAVT